MTTATGIPLSNVTKLISRTPPCKIFVNTHFALPDSALSVAATSVMLQAERDKSKDNWIRREQLS